MKHYEYLIMAIGTDVDIEILCTNQKVLDWIASKMEEVMSYRGHRDFQTLSGEMLGLRFQRLDYRQWNIGWWIIQQLCQQGWKPFAHDTPVHGTSYPALINVQRQVIYHLRREVIVNAESSNQ